LGNIGAPATFATTEPHTGTSTVEEAAAASLRSLRRAAIRLTDLAVEATELDERVQALAEGEREVERSKRDLARAVAANEDAAADLARRESELAAALEKLDAELELLERRTRSVDERARALDARESRLHWRWLLKAWAWRPPLPGRAARVCDLLFVPSSDGYKLIEQDGVALQPGATLTGLLDETASFVVSKIAPWPFDGRWCAYLQQTNQQKRSGR
jgi:prefoldin subunit 5